MVRAEGERAAAELKMAEQRKRRRVQLALAAALGLILLGGGAVAFWQDRQATARRTETQNREREERDRLARNAEAVATLLAQCEAALRADDLDQARVAFSAAEKRADEGGADEHAGRLARCRADLDALVGLERFDTLWWSMTAGAYQTEPAKAQRREAFRAFGVIPDETATDEAVRRLNESAVRERLLAALDNWLASERSPGALAILRAADPDEYRNRVRAAAAAEQSDRVKELAAQPDALAQPPRFAMPLGLLVGGSSERGSKILLTALHRHPGSYPLLMSIGLSFRSGSKANAHERAMWYQAAAAVRPTSSAAWNNLGVALADAGEWERAAASLTEACRLDPKYARSRYNLALTLNGMGDRQGAIRESREAIWLDPKFAPASFNLGIALNETGDRPGAIAAYRDALALNPKFAAAHANLGLVLKQEGDLPGRSPNSVRRSGSNRTSRCTTSVWAACSSPQATSPGPRRSIGRRFGSTPTTCATATRWGLCCSTARRCRRRSPNSRTRTGGLRPGRRSGSISARPPPRGRQAERRRGMARGCEARQDVRSGAHRTGESPARSGRHRRRALSRQRGAAAGAEGRGREDDPGHHPVEDDGAQGRSHRAAPAREVTGGTDWLTAAPGSGCAAARTPSRWPGAAGTQLPRTPGCGAGS